MSREITIEDKKVITTEFRASFVDVFKPKAFKGQEPKFGITMLFPKKTGVGKLLDAAKAAAEDQWGAKADKILAKIKGTKNWPFHDGDKEKPDLSGYPGHYFVTAKAKETNPPGVVNQKRDAIIDPKEFKSGDYARAEVIAYAYDNDFGQGIGFSLQNVQKMRTGESFSGKKDAADTFDDVEDESENAENYESEDSDDDDLIG